MLDEWVASMASDSGDLESALRENLKLRRDLGAEAAKTEAATDTSLRIRYGFQMTPDLLICLAVSDVLIAILAAWGFLLGYAVLG
jgi:hypothetical protein